MTRRVAVVTGTRAEYGLMRSTLRAIAAHPKLTLQTVVTGMHLLRRFGHTVDEIRADGFRVAAEVPMQTPRTGATGLSAALGRGVSGMGAALQRLRSEIVLVTGDRIEALAGALAAAAHGCTVVHVHGGDVAPGHLDESFRHAITKLAHVHCAASQDAARRIVRMGEDPRRVHVVGAPGLDDFRTVAPAAPGWLSGYLSFDPQAPVAIVLYHPIGRPDRREQQTARRILAAVERAGLARLVVYPNSDPGHAGVIAAIDGAARDAQRTVWRAVRSVPRSDFLNALRQATVLIGNSSCGIIEAYSAGLPAVNVGPRQSGRQRNRRAVIDCVDQPRDLDDALARARRVRLTAPLAGVYGAGRAGRAIAGILARCPGSDKLQPKHITY